jgi:hypothetical protein
MSQGRVIGKEIGGECADCKRELAERTADAKREVDKPFTSL